MNDSKIYDASASIGAREYHKKTGLTQELRNAEQGFKDKFIDYQEGEGRVKDEYVDRRNCPLCCSNSGDIVFTKNGFEHVRCTCEMVYVPKVLKKEFQNIIYANKAYERETHESFRTEPRSSFIKAVYEEGFKLVEQTGVLHGLLLDVGSSSGLFMECALSRGFKAKGIEPSPYAVEEAIRRGLNVSQGYFQKGFVADNSLDIVTMWDVLEHCKNPDEVLCTAYRALVPGGIVFLQVPNIMGIAPRIMRKDCNMFTGFGHINLFGPDTLKRILDKNMFKEIKMQSVISEISVINNYLNYHDPYEGPSREKDNILGVLDIETIHNNLWGYKLQVVGKKEN